MRSGDRPGLQSDAFFQASCVFSGLTLAVRLRWNGVGHVWERACNEYATAKARRLRGGFEVRLWISSVLENPKSPPGSMGRPLFLSLFEGPPLNGSSIKKRTPSLHTVLWHAEMP